MVLFLECVIGCLVFGVGIVGSVLANKVFWLQEYAPAVRERFLALHPEHRPADKTEGLVRLVVKKLLVCLLFILLLLFMVYLAGARTFGTGFLYCYIIWSAVNWFDVVVIDVDTID